MKNDDTMTKRKNEDENRHPYGKPLFSSSFLSLFSFILTLNLFLKIDIIIFKIFFILHFEHAGFPVRHFFPVILIFLYLNDD